MAFTSSSSLWFEVSMKNGGTTTQYYCIHRTHKKWLKPTHETSLSPGTKSPSLRYSLFAILIFLSLSKSYTNSFKMKNILSISMLAGLATAYSGDLTYYTTGVGSCGITNTRGDAVVALSVPMVCVSSDQAFSLSRSKVPRHDQKARQSSQHTSDMSRSSGYCLGEGKLTPKLSQMANGGNPNTNPKCGSQISIRHPASGHTVQATVADTCEGCAMYDIDVSESLFASLAGGLSAGRVAVDWGGCILVGLRFLCRKADDQTDFQGQRHKLNERRKRTLCWGSWNC